MALKWSASSISSENGSPQRAASAAPRPRSASCGGAAVEQPGQRVVARAAAQLDHAARDHQRHQRELEHQRDDQVGHSAALDVQRAVGRDLGDDGARRDQRARSAQAEHQAAEQQRQRQHGAPAQLHAGAGLALQVPADRQAQRRQRAGDDRHAPGAVGRVEAEHGDGAARQPAPAQCQRHGRGQPKKAHTPRCSSHQPTTTMHRLASARSGSMPGLTEHDEQHQRDRAQRRVAAPSAAPARRASGISAAPASQPQASTTCWQATIRKAISVADRRGHRPALSAAAAMQRNT